MPHITGIVAADAVAHYGTDYISGSILINAIPYRSMHPEVAHPVIMKILPSILTNDVIEFFKGVRDFVISCATPGRPIPYADMCMWTGAILLQVFSIILARCCHSILIYHLRHSIH
jgi:hypothetical protein